MTAAVAWRQAYGSWQLALVLLLTVGAGAVVGRYGLLGAAALSGLVAGAVLAVVSERAMFLFALGGLVLMPEVASISAIEVVTPILVLRAFLHPSEIQLPTPPRRFLPPLLLLGCAAILSLAVATAFGPIGSLIAGGDQDQLLRTIRFVEVLFVAFWMLRFAAANPRWAGTAVAGSIVAGACVAVALFAAGVPVRAEQQTAIFSGEKLYRAAGVHGDTGSFSVQVGVGVFVLLGLLLADVRRRGRLGPRRAALGLAGLGVLMLALGLSFSRGSLIAVIVGLLVWMAWNRAAALRIAGLLAAIVVAFVALTSVVESPITFDSVERYSQRVGSINKRVAQWSSIASAADVPVVVAGTGFKSYVLATGKAPDNAFLSTTFELGLLGLVALALLLFRTVTYPSAGDRAPLLAFGVFLVIVMMVGDVLTYWRVVPLIPVAAVILAGPRRPVL